MGDTLELTMAALFTNQLPPAPTIAKTVTSGPAPQSIAQNGPAPTADMHSAAEHYNRALAAIRAGDWTEFGTEMKKLGDQLSKPADSAHP
jgi:uncharacterized membrane protein (UPF0182 family)